MKIAVVQTKPIFGEPTANVQRGLELMDQQKADLYILPELFNTGYNFEHAGEVSAMAEPPEGPTFQALARFARERRRYLVYGFAEQADRVYNTAALVGPEGLRGIYRKVHLFDREVLWFAKGDLGFPVFETPLGRIGMMICFDWIYPESARSLALRGAQIIAHPSNLVLPHCPDAMITRCLENRVFAATADRIGTEDRGENPLTFIGKSQVVSPAGSVLVRIGAEEGVAVVEIDPQDADAKSINQHNDLLRQRRVDQYTEEAEI